MDRLLLLMALGLMLLCCASCNEANAGAFGNKKPVMKGAYQQGGGSSVADGRDADKGGFPKRATDSPADSSESSSSSSSDCGTGG